MITIPLYLQLGVGDAERIHLLSEMGPPKHGRALYGPVDSGVLCRSVRGPVHLSLDEALRQAQLAQEENEPPAEETRDDHEPGGLLDGGVAEREGASQGEASEADAARCDPVVETVVPRPCCHLSIRVFNDTGEPQEVTKVMLPSSFLRLYEDDEGRLLTGSVLMHVSSDREASLEDGACPDPRARPLPDLQGQTPRPERLTLLFKHTYKNKTGLEYGF